MNVIVQAGGKGSRLRHHTWNKPKCLVSINNKPILYNLFEFFNNSKFFIIGDYLFDTIKEYLNFNSPNVNYDLIKSDGTGTSSGISKAIDAIDNDLPILIIWSDLLLENNLDFDNISDNTLFVTKKFKCRYNVNENNELTLNDTNDDKGIIGLFYFKNKKEIVPPSNSGEYVEWFFQNQSKFDIIEIENIDELGDYHHYEEKISIQSHCRFFNEVLLKDNIVEKKCINKKFEHLIGWEQSWYDKISNFSFKRMPKIISTNPYILEKIDGTHPFEMSDLTTKEKSIILVDTLDLLSDLHSKDIQESSDDELFNVYVNKTIERIQLIHNLLPKFKKDDYTINGIKCKNYEIDHLKNLIVSFFDKIKNTKFTPIHGDPTFSNILIDKYYRSWLIDPRGYFSKQGIWGDPYYDFSKLYYSVIGNYDFFNRKKFRLYLNDNSIEIMLDNNTFHDIGKDIFNEYFNDQEMFKINFIHSLIWLSFSGYVLDDLDSMFAAYYLGIYWLEKTLA